MSIDYSTAEFISTRQMDAFQMITKTASYKDFKEELLTQEQTDAFQNITEIASQICGTPSAMINFLDEEYQWTLFNTGWRNAKIPREDSICQFTTERDELLHIPDTSQDHRLLDVEAVQNDPDIGFYAGINIKNKLGNKVGTLCVIDKKPRKLTKKQKKALNTLADDIQARLALLRSKVQLEQRNKILVKTSRFLKNSTDFKLILHPESLDIEEVYPEVQGKLGYSPEEMEGTCFTDYCTNKDVAYSIKNWLEHKKTEKLAIETDISIKIGDKLCVSLQISLADNQLFVTGRDISKRKEVEKQLQKEKKMLEGMIQNLPGIFCLIDVHGIIRRWNRNVETITGYSKEELHSSRIDKYLVKKDRSIAFQKLGEVFKHKYARNELTIVSKDGKQIPFLISGFRIKIDNEFLVVVIGVNISDQKQAEQSLKKTLKEREVLLAEIHHRVKNNLAVVSGLVQLEQMNRVENPSTDVLSNTVSRIKSIALVHEKLYASNDFKNVSLKSYVNELLASFENRCQNGIEVRVDKQIDETKLNINQAVPVGFLLNELITNAYNRALHNEQAIDININIENNQDQICIKVSENSTGSKEQNDPDNQSSFGQTLIDVLAKQLSADYTVEADASGTHFSLSFKNQTDITGASANLFPV